MGRLADNVKDYYDFRIRQKNDFLNMLRDQMKREHEWNDELAKHGVKREVDTSLCIAQAMSYNLVPDPPIALDVMMWLSDKLESARKFFVPTSAGVCRYVIPPGYGVDAGVYESRSSNVAVLVDDKEALFDSFIGFLDNFPFVCIQCLCAEEYRNDNHNLVKKVWVKGVRAIRPRIEKRQECVASPST